MSLALRKLLMASLVAAFAIQTTLVYTDDTHERFEPLSEQALEGRRLWHQHNCYVCHQIYGFGGFLGPDLTNVSRRANKERFTQILTEGNLQMPAFHFGVAEIEAFMAFFANLDSTGLGQAKKFLPHTPLEACGCIDKVAAAHPLPAAAQPALQTLRSVCVSCHVPLRDNHVGALTSPDLSTVVTRLKDAEILEVLRKGRPAKGMPPGQVPADQEQGMLQLLHWLHEHRDELRAELGPAQGSDSLPWWEFDTSHGAGQGESR